MRCVCVCVSRQRCQLPGVDDTYLFQAIQLLRHAHDGGGGGNDDDCTPESIALMTPTHGCDVR